MAMQQSDELSETAGFKIITSSKKYLFIPDIDKWEKWNKNITKEVQRSGAKGTGSDVSPQRQVDQITMTHFVEAERTYQEAYDQQAALLTNHMIASEELKKKMRN